MLKTLTKYQQWYPIIPTGMNNFSNNLLRPIFEFIICFDTKWWYNILAMYSKITFLKKYICKIFSYIYLKTLIQLIVE